MCPLKFFIFAFNSKFLQNDRICLASVTNIRLRQKIRKCFLKKDNKFVEKTKVDLVGFHKVVTKRTKSFEEDKTNKS